MKTEPLPEQERAESEHHIFQYGIVPLKFICQRQGENIVLWENTSPNSQMSVRPIFLIREKETNEQLLEEVISTTDKERDRLNGEGMTVNFRGADRHIKIDIKDTMKDMKFKRLISGRGGASCILCHSKPEDWNAHKKVTNGFKNF